MWTLEGHGPVECSILRLLVVKQYQLVIESNERYVISAHNVDCPSMQHNICGFSYSVYGVPNVPNDLCWSTDLQWQSPKFNPGFYDITDGVLMTCAKGGDITPNWESFLKVNRREFGRKKYFRGLGDSSLIHLLPPWIFIHLECQEIKGFLDDLDCHLNVHGISVSHNIATKSQIGIVMVLLFLSDLQDRWIRCYCYRAMD